ncbi:ras guanine nucleotide exchange factor domain-containing protein, partial [Chytridium lagenaria]
FAIIYGLRRPAVMKQTSAWEQVPSKYLEILKDLEHTMDPADGYANFWMELKTTHPPAIPLFAAYIHDLLEIHHDIPIYLSTDSLSRPAHVEDDDTPTPTTTPMSNGVPIHFAKFYDLYAVVAELEVWRTASYSSVIQTPERETTAIVLNHLKDYPVMEERVLWEGAAAPGAGVGGAGSPGKGSPDRMGGLRRMGSFVAGEK